MNQNNEFKRSLGFIDATNVVIGSMIGSGIFLVSCESARIINSPGLLLICWLIVGVATVFAALSYGELAGMMPFAGGQYVYLKEIYGKLSAFLYGWTLFTVMHSGTIAAVAIAFAKYTGAIFPVISSSNWIFKFSIHEKFTTGLNTENLLGISVIIFLTWINTRGINTGKIIQNIFTFTKFFSIIFLIIVSLTIGINHQAVALNLSHFWDLPKDLNSFWNISIVGLICISMIGPLFSSGAWDTITYISSEIKNPKKNIPLSLFIGASVVIALYFLLNIAYLCVLPLQGSPNGINEFERGIQYATNDRIGAAAASSIFGGMGTIIMAVLIMISTFGCNNGIILSTARVYYAMAQDNLFFKKAGELNKHHVPSNALIFQCIWSCILCISGTYSNLLDYVVSAWLVFYTVTIFGIFILRKKLPNAERPYKVIGYPLIPVIYILFTLTVLICIFIMKPHYTWSSLIILLMGVPIYFFWNRNNLKK